MKIHLLWATIRPAMFLEAHKEWMRRADNPENIQTYVAVNWKENADQLREYLKSNYLITLNTNNIGVCYPSYQLSSNLGIKMGKCEDDDIVIFASDDFIPPENFDKYLFEKFKSKGDVGLLVRDGYQLPDSSNMKEADVSIPILNYGCLKKLNMIIYNPSYNHMYSDAELYLNLKESNMLLDDRINDETIFEHRHFITGKRQADQADQIYYSKWQQDEITWNKRKNLNLIDRLKL